MRIWTIQICCDILCKLLNYKQMVRYKSRTIYPSVLTDGPIWLWERCFHWFQYMRRNYLFSCKFDECNLVESTTLTYICVRTTTKVGVRCIRIQQGSGHVDLHSQCRRAIRTRWKPYVEYIEYAENHKPHDICDMRCMIYFSWVFIWQGLCYTWWFTHVHSDRLLCILTCLFIWLYLTLLLLEMIEIINSVRDRFICHLHLSAYSTLFIL